MPKPSEVIDITGYPLIPLEKNAENHYPFPRIRCGILPYYINSTGQIIWGCIESNRVEPITLSPAAGTQDIIALKSNQRLLLEAGKPLPELNIPGITAGEFFRGQVYQDTLNHLVHHGFKVYLENPLATAIHEAHEEHGIDLHQTSGLDRHLLRTPLEHTKPITTEDRPDVAAVCMWFPELKNIEGIQLRHTHKTDTKMRRNFGRKFYEQGCWVTLDDFKTKFNQERKKFSSFSADNYTEVKLQLITEAFKAFRLNIQLLKRIELLLQVELYTRKQAQKSPTNITALSQVLTTSITPQSSYENAHVFFSTTMIRAEPRLQHDLAKYQQDDISDQKHLNL
ncbi:MAG: hypothetical protein P1U61_07365 [Legionellaceae bacterium]|nr:hypothetical protein [Legionellaceae bacterium]